MEHFDEEILERKWQIERQKHTTIETGMYAGDELILFENINIPHTTINMYLPASFTILPENVREIKYPSRNGPDFIVSNEDTTVSFAFKQLEMQITKGGTKELGLQSQQVLKNLNSGIRIREQRIWETDEGNEAYWYEYNGHQIDGQSYNQVHLIALKQHLLYAAFSCLKEDKSNWKEIAKKLFYTVKEDANLLKNNSNVWSD